MAELGVVKVLPVLGPMLVGVFINCILYGVMVVQAYIYFETYYKRDTWWIKTFVFYLLICETLNTGCDIAMMYEPLIMNYGSPRVLEVAPVMIASSPLLTVMVSTPVQLFIAWRVKVMSKSRIVPIIISILALASCAGGFATTISICIGHFEYIKLHQLQSVAITWLASSTVADVLITVSLVYNLWSRRTGFVATDGYINKIIRLTIQTGLLTSLSALIDVTLPGVIRNTTLNFVWDFALSKLYSNSLLSTLNARAGWRLTASVQENVLFGNGSSRDSIAMSRSRSGVDATADVDPHVERRMSVPMKVILGTRHRDDPSTSDLAPFTDKV